MGAIGTDRRCSRCGDQVRLRVATPGPTSITDSLTRLLDVGLDQRVILVAECGCSTPRFVGLRGAPVLEEEI